MLSYSTDGVVLTIVAGASTTPEEREAVFSAIRADDRVPDDAPLILDARAFEEQLTLEQTEKRVRAMIEDLRPKLGWVCAMLVREGQAFDATQVAANTVGLRLSVFKDEQKARRWLAPYIRL